MRISKKILRDYYGVKKIKNLLKSKDNIHYVILLLNLQFIIIKL